MPIIMMRLALEKIVKINNIIKDQNINDAIFLFRVKRTVSIKYCLLIYFVLVYFNIQVVMDLIFYQVYEI